MTRVVLGVCGGIAAYKAVELLRDFTESGFDVTVVPTSSALRFVGEPTWAALSGKAVASEVWTDPEQVRHVALGQQADVVVVAPATADFLARASHGIASDLLTNVLLTASCPVIMAPAMHTEMWQHPATQRNVATLRDRGVLVLEPASGRLTGADSGPGRLPEPEVIADLVREVVRRSSSGPNITPVMDVVMDLRGQHVVISAGGTREAWDSVRYLGNRSSGRQGVALARAAVTRGAQVTLVTGAMEVSPPAGVRVINVESAEHMRESLHALIADEEPDVVVMAAAVADFRPHKIVEGKITKEAIDADGRAAVPDLPLERTVDILAEIATKRGSAQSPLLVGFAAEAPADDETLEQRALAKLGRKGCDLLVANDVTGGAVFGDDRTSVLVVGRDGVVASGQDVSKLQAAQLVWDAVVSAPRATSAPPGSVSAG